MFVAYDKDGNRIYADEYKGEECFCPKCGKPVRHRMGKIRKAHFSHRPEENCPYGLDKDYKSEWHIRMQEYFPKEAREYRFKDEETGEIHIADVFLEEANTVLEFQHSRIEEEEFVKRTAFHLKQEGRRVVWLFDESVESEKPNYGRFKPTYVESSAKSLNEILNYHYHVRTYKWLRNPRRMIKAVPKEYLHSKRYGVCVFTGTEGDVFHRIVDEHYDYEEVVFSLHDIQMSEAMNVDEFFLFESHWQNQEPWKADFEERKNYCAEVKEYIKRQTQASTISRPVYSRRRRRW